MNKPHFSSHAEPEDMSLDLAELLGLLWQKKFRILFIFSILMVAATYYIISLPKYYSSSTTLHLSNDKAELNLPSTLGALAGVGDTELDTYIEFIRSRQFADMVINKLNLRDQAEFKAEEKTNAITDEQYANEIFRTQMSILKVPETDLLKISFESKSAHLAMDVANAIGPLFFDFYANLQRQKADDASTWLNSQVVNLQSELDQSELRLQEFVNANKLVDITSQLSLMQNEIMAIMAERFANDKKLSQLNATLRQAEYLNKDAEQLRQMPELMSNGLVMEMRRNVWRQQEAIAELSKRYKSKHPKHIAATTRLISLEREYSDLVFEVLDGMRLESDNLTRRQRLLDEQIDGLKNAHSDLGRQQIELAKLQREAESTQKLYDLLLGRLQETEIIKDIGNKDNFSVIDFASLPNKPSRPRTLLLLVMAGIFSFLFSAGFWLVLHFLSDSQARFRQTLRSFEIPIIAMLPKTKHQRLISISRMFTDQKRQEEFQFAEAIRNVRTAIVVRDGAAPLRTIAVVRIKTVGERRFLSRNLAESFSRLDKTLLVDLNLRAPRLGKLAKLSDSAPGITNFIDKKARFGACLHKQRNSSLTLLPSGPTPQDPLAYISKPRFTAIVKKLGVLFDRVVIDTPEVNAYADAMVISRAVDAVILVADLEKDDVDDLAEAIQRLKEVDAPVIGVVLKNVRNLPVPLGYRSSKLSFLRTVLFERGATR